MADLASVKPSEIMHKITHPASGKYLGVTVSLISITDDRMKPILNQIRNEKLRLEMRGKNFKAEQIDDNSVDIAFRAMTGWVWEKDDDGEQAEFNGKVPDFNAANVKAVLTTLPWFRDQITAKISEEKDFFQG